MQTGATNKNAERAPSKAKRRILVAAASLFRRRGYARSTVRELADEVGIQSGSLFHHFKSKEEILFALMAEVIDLMDATLKQAIAEAPTTEQKVRALIHNQLTFIHGEHQDSAAVLVYEWESLSPENQARLLAGRDGYFERWSEVLSLAKKEGLIQVDPVILRQLLLGASVWSANWYDPAGELSLAELEDAVIKLVLPSRA